MRNFLPRGSIVRNTGGIGILAMTIYTGSQTKLILNQGKTGSHKKSNMEKTTQMMYWI